MLKFCMERGKRDRPAKHGASASPPESEPAEKSEGPQSSQPGPSAIAFICTRRCDEKPTSSFALLGNIEMLSISKFGSEDAGSDEPNVMLAPDEIATLTDLMSRYDQVLVDIETLNGRLEELLKVESPKKEEEPAKG